MCGRFYIDPELEKEIKAVVEAISNKYKDTPELSAMKTGEIYPTDIVPVLTAGSPMLMKWGFTGYTGKGQIINARSETAADKPMFRKSFLRKRCLIPANYYFEWENGEQSSRNMLSAQVKPYSWQAFIVSNRMRDCLGS